LPYSFTFSPVFNRPGKFDMTLPLDDKIAYSIAKHKTCVVCERNDALVWSGGITSVSRDPAANTLTLTAIGWLDELNHRFVRASEEPALTFTDVVGGQIASTLLNTCNLQTDTMGVQRPTHVGFYSNSDVVTRTRAYKRGQSYGSALQELSDVESGFDIFYNHAARAVVIKPPDAFVVRDNVAFGYGVEPYNLSNATQSDDGTNTANRVTAVGSNGIITPADDVDSIVSYGGLMLEAWESLSNIADAAIIGAYANAEVIYRKYGQITYDMSPLPYGDIPRLFDDYELGDEVFLSIDHGALKVDRQGVRIFSVTINVDAQGNEVISSIGTSPS
jgi:hypothetical protein